MQIFDINGGFNPSLQTFETGFQVPTIDFPLLSDVGNVISNSKEQELENVLSTLDSLNNFQDEITKIRIDNPSQQEMLNRALSRANLNKDSFKLSIEDIRDPNKLRNVQRSVISLSNQPELRELLTEQAFADSFEQSAFSIGNIGLRTKALKQLRDYKEGRINARDLDIQSFTPVDSSKVIQDSFSKLDNVVSARVNEELSQNGFQVFEKTSSKVGQSVDALVNNLSSNEQFINSLIEDNNFSTRDEAINLIRQTGETYKSEFVNDILIRQRAQGKSSASNQKQQLSLQKVNDVRRQLARKGKFISDGQVLGLLNAENFNFDEKSGELFAGKLGGKQTLIDSADITDEQLRNILGNDEANQIIRDRQFVGPVPNQGVSSTGSSPASRNNNPLNLREVGESEGFRSFEGLSEGFEAGVRDLTIKLSGQSKALKRVYGENYLEDLDVTKLIEVFSPRSDNPEGAVGNYIEHVSNKLGVSPTEPIKDIDPRELAAAMASFEDPGVYEELKELGIVNSTTQENNVITTPSGRSYSF